MSQSPDFIALQAEVLSELKPKFSALEHEGILSKAREIIKADDQLFSKRLFLEDPFKEDLISYEHAHKHLAQGKADKRSLDEDLEDLKKLSIKAQNIHTYDFWKPQIGALEASSDISKSTTQKDQNKTLLAMRSSLQSQWLKLLDKSHHEWELDQITKYREALLAKLKDWLSLVQLIYDLLTDLSLTPGLLLDLSDGSLTHADVAQLERWANYIAKNQGVKDLCDMLGKLEQAKSNAKKKITQMSTQVEIETIDVHSREEVIGLKLSNAIENTVSQELALLTDPETSLLFDLKFIESRLLSFEHIGIQNTSIQTNINTSTVEEQPKGPIIICVDTSGSMYGSPETIAKAICLYLASRARDEERDCYLINFSTSIDTLDLSGSIGLANLMKFLSKSFHGGTDVNPALDHALSIIEKEQYKSADILVISDFILAGLSENLQHQVKKAKLESNQFYSLSIGNIRGSTQLDEVFDKKWVYNPNNQSITQIANFLNDIER